MNPVGLAAPKTDLPDEGLAPNHLSNPVPSPAWPLIGPAVPTLGERTLRKADRLAVALAAARSWIGAPLARAAEAFVRCQNWLHFGYARSGDYARERIARSARWLGDLARLGEALDRLPELGEALSGQDGLRPIGRIAAQWIGATASTESARAWIELARRVPVRELREAIRRARTRGSKWPDPAVCEGEEPSLEYAGASEGGDHSRQDSPATEGGESEDDFLDEPCRVRMAVPLPVRAAFEEGLEIHRAVSGQESSVTSFVEALVADAYAGLHPPDVEIAPVRRGEALAAREEHFARRTGNWEELERASEGAEILDEAENLLVRANLVAERAGEGNALDLDRQLRVLTMIEDEIECLLGRFLAEMGERGAWSQLQFTGVGHYGEQRLGLSRTSVEDRAGLARALRELPALREAYEKGWVGLEAALLVRRILGRGPVESRLERKWVLHAKHVTVKRLRDEARMLAREEAERLAACKLAASESETSAAWKLTPPEAETSAEAKLMSKQADELAARRLTREVEMEGSDGSRLTPEVETEGVAESKVALDEPQGLDCSRVTGAAHVEEATGAPAESSRAARSRPAPPGDASWRESLYRAPGMSLGRIAWLGWLAARGSAPDVLLRLRLPKELAESFLATIESRRRELSQAGAVESSLSAAAGEGNLSGARTDPAVQGTRCERPARSS